MSYKIETIKRRNIGNFILGIVVLILLCLILYWEKIIHCPDEKLPWYESKADLFLVFVSIFGVVGAFWSLFAKIDAEKAFTQSKETYEALANSFDFHQIYDNDKLSYIYQNIGKENRTVTLLLNFPLVGLFTQDKDFVYKANQIFHKELITGLEDLTDNFPDNFKLNIACYTKEYALSFLVAGKHDEEERRINNFYNLIESLENKCGNSDKFNRFYFNKDIGLRIALVNPHYRKNEGLALVWTVSDFIPEDSAKFEAASFKTVDRCFIETLDKVFRTFYQKAIKNESIDFLKTFM